MAAPTQPNPNDTPAPGNTDTIRARYAHYGPTHTLKPNTAVADIRYLLDVIDRLTNHA